MSFEDESVSGKTFSLTDVKSTASSLSLRDAPSTGSKYSLRETASEILIKSEHDSYVVPSLELLEQPDLIENSVGDFVNPEDKQSNYDEAQLNERMSHRLDQLAKFENSLSDTSAMGDGNVEVDEGEQPILTWKKFLEKVRKNQES